MEAASEHRSEAPSWTQGLTRYGKYYTGIVEESNLDKILELHKRDTVSTFGTRSSRRVMKTKPQRGNKNDDNDSDAENLAPQPVNEVKISVRKLYKYCCIYCSVCRGCTGSTQ